MEMSPFTENFGLKTRGRDWRAASRLKATMLRRNNNTGRGDSAMVNIPTDLLRTLISVVDLRSFTKAAQALGVTQPAVSAQIKRLQSLLTFDILDKSAPGVILTPRGEIVVTYARRLLSI